MIIVSLIVIVTGILLILYSSELSGRALNLDDVFREGGFLRLVKHIIDHRPFAGYHNDIRVLVFGVVGLAMVFVGSAMLIYFITWVYATAGAISNR